MARVCQVCTHESVQDINLDLIRRKPYRDIARRYGVNKDAVMNHNREHLPKLLTMAVEAEQAANADSLLDRIEDLHARTLAILTATEGTQDKRTALAAIREARGNLELIGEVTKELDRSPTLNLHLNAEWLEVRAVIVQALEPHPEARESVLRALGAAGNGRP